MTPYELRPAGWQSQHQTLDPATVFKGEVLVYEPVDPPSNHCGMVSLASGGYRNEPVFDAWDDPGLMTRIVPYLTAGYTVFRVNHGQMTTLRTEEGFPHKPVIPAYTGIEILQHGRDALQFIKWICTHGRAQNAGNFNVDVDRDKLTIVGGSSGGVVALAIHCMQEHLLPEVNELRMPVPLPAMPHESIADTRTAACFIFSAGVDGENFRYQADSSFVFSRPQFLIHPDLSGVAVENSTVTPSTYSYPNQAPYQGTPNSPALDAKYSNPTSPQIPVHDLLFSLTSVPPVLPPATTTTPPAAPA
ncbi:MAG: hypothetical protein KDB53_00550, partial [Planctomycetes bacterium]|nr:hypothetical protein [Planctomycetota bacterium]